MKNLKVGMKIFVGFAVVVAMMVVMCATVVVTTVMISRNARSIQSSSALQTALNDTLTTLGSARIQANIIYNVTNQEANDAFGQYDAEVKSQGQTALSLAQADPATAHYATDIQAFLDAYGAWSDKVHEVIALNDRMGALGTEAITDAEAVYQTFRQALAARITAEAPPAQMTANLTAMDKMAAVLPELVYMRDTFETTGVETITTNVSDVVSLLENSIAIAEDPAVAESLQAALDNARGLQDVVGAFIAENETGWTLVDETRSAGAHNVEMIGALTVSLDNDMDSSIAATVGLGQATIWIVLGVALFSIAVAVVMGIVISRLITIPTKGLSFSLKHLAETGSLQLPDDVGKLAAEVAQRKDELGEAAVNYGLMLQRLGYLSGELDKVADGDLTSDVELASEQDVMGQSLKKMVGRLGGMFGEINNATVQVASGSKQIADGAQGLAQGSTEQAAAVQQLSSSITEVAAKTDENADLATEAAKLAGTIKQGAEKGSAQMGQMMQAVQEITEASQKISSVIKVIDDIAFQTNILALNAAVEAARAGQHGKGFAVVAEEVRNLAGKSAEAARNTGGLIANSIEKAELGADIAKDTAESLTEIVEGINRSSQLVQEIATSSGAQSAAIREINIGIDQVAQVVQQNSATAEESAAASEEMNGQADILERLVAQFRLKGDAYSAGLPAHTQRAIPAASGLEPIGADVLF